MALNLTRKLLNDYQMLKKSRPNCVHYSSHFKGRRSVDGLFLKKTGFWNNFTVFPNFLKCENSKNLVSFSTKLQKLVTLKRGNERSIYLQHTNVDQVQPVATVSGQILVRQNRLNSV